MKKAIIAALAGVLSLSASAAQIQSEGRPVVEVSLKGARVMSVALAPETQIATVTLADHGKCPCKPIREDEMAAGCGGDTCADGTCSGGGCGGGCGGCGKTVTMELALKDAGDASLYEFFLHAKSVAMTMVGGAITHVSSSAAKPHCPCPKPPCPGPGPCPGPKPVPR